MSYRDQRRRILLLLVLASLVQSWAVARNSVPAQDALVFLRFSRQLQHQSFLDALRSNAQHPLFPALTWLFHQTIGFSLSSGGLGWIRSAQCVAAAASILLVVPMYLAGVRLAGRELAMGAAAIFTVLPLAARMGADALADSTYLLCLLVAFWASIEFLVTRRCGWLGLSGIATGVGFLARPEALLLIPAFASTLVVVQFQRRRRVPWPCLGRAIAMGCAGMLCTVLPYMVSVGRITPKGSLNFLPRGQALFSRFDLSGGRPPVRTFSDGQSVAAPGDPVHLPASPDGTLDFALQHREQDKKFIGYGAATRELFRELVEGLHYALGLLVLIGFLAVQRRPPNLLCSILAVLFLALLLQFASRAGYVASRHVIALVCFGCYTMARGGWVLASAIAGKATQWRKLKSEACTTMRLVLHRRRRRFALAVLVIAAILCLPKSLAVFHQSRDAHVAAARWLTDHAPAGSIVLDSRGWASLLSDLPAYDYNGARLAFQDSRLAFVVLENLELSDQRPRGTTLRHLLGLAGHKVAEFPCVQAPSESVEIFAWNSERLTRPGDAGPMLRGN